MPHPLAGDENRHLGVEGELNLLERARVPVFHQIVDEAAVLAVSFGALSIADSGGLNDPLVATHVVHQAHKSLI